MPDGSSSFTSQREDRIELYSAADGRGAPREGHKHGDGYMIGNSTGSIEICELKIERPIWRASSAPAENPARPPMQRQQQRLREKDRRNREISRAQRLHQSDFDSAFINRRAIAAETASADANSAANVISSMSPLMRESTVPSFCATCRICSACECGMTSCNW